MVVSCISMANCNIATTKANITLCIWRQFDIYAEVFDFKMQHTILKDIICSL